jgi:hypothetical protein
MFEQMSIDVLPDDELPLVVMGDNGSPIENYPLGECQGGKSVSFFTTHIFVSIHDALLSSCLSKTTPMLLNFHFSRLRF